MGRYFGREPRYTRQELERQAQEAIDARISLGRPPEEDFLPLQQRLAEIDRELAARPQVEPLPESQPLRIHHVRPPAVATVAPAPAPAKARTGPKAETARRPVGARTRAN